MRTLARGNVFYVLAQHGFVVLYLSVRDTDGSEGVVTDEYSLIEQTDGYDAGERVAAQDIAGRERLLRYCARPMFAAVRLVWAGEGAQARYRLRGRRCKSTG